MCPYIVDWSMRDEMSGMPKNTFDAIEVIVRYVSHSVQCGISNMWHYNAILTNLDPFHTIEQKRHPISMAIDFIKTFHLRREILYNITSVLSYISFLFTLMFTQKWEREVKKRSRKEVELFPNSLPKLQRHKKHHHKLQW